MPDVREYRLVVDEAEQAARAGDFALADLRLRDALRLQEDSLGVGHPDLASTLNNLAVVCETLGRFDDAELFYRRAYAIAAGSLPPGDPLVVTSRENLKDFCTARGLPLEEWPGIGRTEAPAPPPPPAPTVAATPAGAPRPAGVPRPAATTPAETSRAVAHAPAPAAWPTRVIGTVVVLAAIGALVVVTSRREVAPTGSPVTVATRPPASAPAVPAAAEPAVVTPPPAAVAPAEPATAPSLPAAPAALPASAPPVAAPPAGVRIVVADVCASLSTSGAWRCDPLGATAAPGRAAFYTRLASPRPLRVQHRWYQGTALRQSVTLSVGASPSDGYRTFSRQTLTPGAWRVELRGADGTVLHAAAFDIR